MLQTSLGTGRCVWGPLAGIEAVVKRGKMLESFLLMPTSAVLLSITGGCFVAQIVLSIRFFLAFSRSLVQIPQERGDPPGMMTSL